MNGEAMTEPTPRTAPPGTRVRVTRQARNYDDRIEVGEVGVIRYYSPEHHVQNGGGYDVQVDFGRLFLGPDFDAMGGNWQGPDGKTVLVRSRKTASIWSRHLEVVR